MPTLGRESYFHSVSLITLNCRVNGKFVNLFNILTYQIDIFPCLLLYFMICKTINEVKCAYVHLYS